MHACTDLDGFICAARDKSGAGHIKRRTKHASLGVERTRLGHIIEILEGSAGGIVPESERTVIT